MFSARSRIKPEIKKKQMDYFDKRNAFLYDYRSRKITEITNYSELKDSKNTTDHNSGMSKEY